ncbi:MAG: hypothetical protein LLF97_02050 [Planctomycetaceae bacterium]|nr:hypothetical protein [Planctomycetaceae bacterium]
MQNDGLVTDRLWDFGAIRVLETRMNSHRKPNPLPNDGSRRRDENSVVEFFGF